MPIFAGLVLGYIAGLRKTVDNRNVRSLITFLMTFTLPCSLFVAIALTPREALWRQTRSAIALATVYLVIYVATYFASKYVGRDSAPNSAVLALTIAFPNAAAVGIPLLVAVYGPGASVGVAVAIAIGAVTITPITLAILENANPKAKAHESALLTSLWRALKKPVFWAPMLGVLAAVASFQMPPYLNRSLTILGGATEGTALFVTGLIASAQRFRMDWGVGWAVAGKGILQPALCLAIALLLNTPIEETRRVVLLAAIPCGFFGILFGEGFEVASELASSTLIASTISCVFTLTGWIVLLGRLR
ncbi:MAG: AEC family transporter [Ignavibacteriota bacterium]